MMGFALTFATISELPIFFFADRLLARWSAKNIFVFGHFMLDEMHKRGVDMSNVIIDQDGQTGLSVILNRGSDRAILTHPGLIPALRASDIPEELLRQSRHIHVASYFLQTRLQPGLPALFRRAHELGLTTSLDTNYDPSEEWAGFDKLLSVTNVFLPNEKEAISFSGEINVDLAASKLGFKVEALAIKLGAKGALGVRCEKRVRVPPIPVKVVDTVGAGDSFDAGFIYGYFHKWELKKNFATGLRVRGFVHTKSWRNRRSTWIRRGDEVCILMIQ